MPGDARTCEIACDLRPAGGSIDRMGILRYIVQGFGWVVRAWLAEIPARSQVPVHRRGAGLLHRQRV